jgi:hypothetical protein
VNKKLRVQTERLLGRLLDIPLLTPFLLRWHARIGWQWYQISTKYFAITRPTDSQRRQILAIRIITPVLMAILYYFGIMAEKASLDGFHHKTDYARVVLVKFEAGAGQTKEIAAQLAVRRRLLARREAILAPSWDSYSWFLKTVRSFSRTHDGISLVSYGQPLVSDAGMLPKFPYRWATFHIEGTGYYDKFGSFFADLENTFQYFRVQNVVMVPNTAPDAQPETLLVNFDLVTPIAPTGLE